MRRVRVLENAVTKVVLYEEALVHGISKENMEDVLVELPDGTMRYTTPEKIQFLDPPAPAPQAKPLSDSDRAHMEDLRVRAEKAEGRLAWIASKVTAIRDDITSISIGFQGARGVDWVTGRTFRVALEKGMRETGDAP